MCAHDHRASDCPIYQSIEVLSRKWALHIMRHLSDKGEMRFTEIKEEIPDLSSRLLSQRLTELAAFGLVRRTEKRGRPPVVGYAITPKGRDLKKMFDVFCAWCRKWGAEWSVSSGQ
jgi:DNA-binding HxlR family transcriptional regulator